MVTKQADGALGGVSPREAFMIPTDARALGEWLIAKADEAEQRSTEDLVLTPATIENLSRFPTPNKNQRRGLARGVASRLLNSGSPKKKPPLEALLRG
jgi:hypothetical protein